MPDWLITILILAAIAGFIFWKKSQKNKGGSGGIGSDPGSRDRKRPR